MLQQEPHTAELVSGAYRAAAPKILDAISRRSLAEDDRMSERLLAVNDESFSK